MAINTGSHPKALWPGVNAWFGLSYKKHPENWKKVFSMHSSGKAYEEDVQSTSFGLMPVKGEGDAIRYDTHNQGFVKRYTNITYGMGYIVTEEEREDNQYATLGSKRAGLLAFSAQTTKEIVHANILNRAFNSSYLGGDGKELLATDHPSLAGDWSNELSSPADFSEAAVEDLVTQIRQATNDRGLRIELTPKRLIGPASLEWDMKRLMQTAQTLGTNNNDANVVRGSFPDGMLTWVFLDDQDAWFISTDCPDGLKHFNRKGGAFMQDNDFDTSNAKAKFTERYACGWTDPRALYGVPGA